MKEQTKKGIAFYKDLLLNATPKMEIVNYLKKRIKGEHILFKRDVIYNYYYNKRKKFSVEDRPYIKINCGRVMENCKVASKTFEPNVAELINSYKTGTFIDCGAHIGKYSLIAARNGMKVYSIEASPVNHDLLEKNKILNNLQFDSVEGMVGSKTGWFKFYISEMRPATNSASPIVNAVKKDTFCYTLDNLCQDFKHLHLIKIDVEGSEAEVIKGGWRLLSKFHPDIIFECANLEAYEEVTGLLKELGYYTFKNIDEYTYFTKVSK